MKPMPVVQDDWKCCGEELDAVEEVVRRLW